MFDVTKIDLQEVEIPEGKKLLEDVCELDFKPGDLHEESGKRPYLKGRLGLTDEATANRRLYPRKLMARELQRLQEDMKSRKVFGELDHPGDGKTKLARVSHLVTEAIIESNGEILGVIEFIPGTINGDQALAIARAGGKLGVSSRGFGSTSTDSKGNDVVQEDYKLVTWDIVADPANAGAHPEFVMEDKEIKMDLNTLKKEHPELVEALTSEIESDARSHAREALRGEFEEQLRTEAKAIREEAVEKARGELLEDPEVAGSATAMARIKEVVAPFIVSEDELGEVAKLKKQIAVTERRLADADEAKDKAVEEAKELSSICKELGFHLYLEREHRDNDRLEQITELLGDVTQYSDLEAFKGRVSEISEALAEEDKVHEEYEEKISALQKEKEKLEEERNKALMIGKQLGIRAYVERKIADNPRSRQLRSYLEESAPEDKGDVDALVASFNKANPTSQDYDKVRKGIEKRSRVPLTEDGTDRNSGNDLVGDVLGVPMRELVARSVR
jgi:hypothetical protein